MTATRKVLIVDDDPVISKSFDRVLAEWGYAVISAQNGNEALDKLAREDYDAVFTDIKMPGMSGIEVAQHIKATRPWLPVVIVTGYGSDENEARAKRAGVNAFLRKPLSPEMIEQSAREAFAAAAAAVTPAAVPAAAAAPAPTAARSRVATFLRNVALFFAAPFIGLAYVVALPFVGLGLLAWHGARAVVKRNARS